jgi:acetolactate synthase I/II/III large subunit
MRAPTTVSDSWIEGGELLARTLRDAGVDTVFALHGGHLESFYRGCFSNEIRLVDFRHESSAGHAADGYARATGKLGVCVITAGPGFTNATTAILNAQLDSIPTLFIIGGPPLREDETNALQGGFDQIAAALPMVKYAHRITSTERIQDLTALAIRKATTGRRGAVLLELPIDVLHMRAHTDDVRPPHGLHVHPRPSPHPEEIKTAISVLKQSERPVIIVGGEARFSDCRDDLIALAEATRIPVFSNARGMGVFPSSHPLNGQIIGNLALLGDQRPDAALLLGTRFGFRMAGRGTSLLPAEARLIQVHSDAAELSRLRHVELPIVADVGAALHMLRAAVGAESWPERSAWIKSTTMAPEKLQALYPRTQGTAGIHPFRAAEAAVRAAGPNAAIVLDGGEAASWAAFHLRADKAGHVQGLGYLGALGTGPGMSIGAQIADPGKRVMQITGDGAIGFHIQEFDTMVRHRLPICTVVLNNQIWGMSIHGQQIMYGANYSAISELSGTNYASIAAAFGCHGERVTDFAEIEPAIARAYASGKPACIEIMIDPDVVHPVTTAALGTISDEKREIMIPYYENIPIRTPA